MINDDPCPLCDNPAASGKLLRKHDDILACLRHFRDKKQEYLVCLSLDSGQRLIARRIVTIGLLSTSLAHPREVFAGPLVDRAAAVIVAHNHPSNEATPSQEDITTTQQLVAAGILLGIPVRDHFILTANSYYSFRQHSMI
jgi:DNA repair protein RadC